MSGLNAPTSGWLPLRLSRFGPAPTKNVFCCLRVLLLLLLQLVDFEEARRGREVLLVGFLSGCLRLYLYMYQYTVQQICFPGKHVKANNVK